MFKIEVINKLGQAFYNEKETRAELDAWLEKEKIKKSFGKIAGIYQESQLRQDELVGAVEIIPGENEIHSEKIYQIQDQFTYEITDITSQVEQEKINQESLEYLKSTDYLIIRELDNGTPCPVEIKQLREQARQRIVR